MNEDDLKAVYDKLLKADNYQALQDLADDFKKEINDFEKKYPKIDIQFSPNEVHALKDQYFQEDLRFKEDITTGKAPLEKLLLALIWKNGMWNRCQSIMEGLTDKKEHQSKTAVIFRQFGRSLKANSIEPIIDKHCLRAFGLFHNNGGRKDLIKENSYSDTNSELPEAYRTWFCKLINTFKNQQKESAYMIDKIMFCLGKKAKAFSENKIKNVT